MSQRNRRVLAALGLAAALCLTLPVPSQAAGLRGFPGVGLTVRAWAWLERLGLGDRPAAANRRPAVVWEKEGSMIDPDGRTNHTTPPASATSYEGSAIDPDGRR